MYISDIRSGVDFETYVRSVLKSSGIHVRTTKMSHDFGSDLLFDYAGLTYSVQCKWSSRKIGVSAVQEVCASLHMYGADVGVVVTNSEFTTDAMRLAASNGAVLFDGPSCQPYVSSDSEMGLDRYLLDKLLVCDTRGVVLA